MDRPLDDFADIVRGITFAKSEGSASSNDGLLPVIRAGSIQSELLVEKDQIWVPRDKIRENQLIRKNDILMCTSSGSAGLVGKCAKAEFDWDGSFGAFCAGIRPKKENCDPSFLYHFLSSPRFRNWSKGSAGANIKNIRTSELANFPVPDVPLPEQKRIAAILDRADAIRRKRQQAIDLADEFLRSLFLDMFGDIVTNPKGFKKGPITKIADVITGYAFKSTEYIEDGENAVRLCRGANTLTGYFDWQDTTYWPAKSLTGLEHYLLNEGDVVLAMDRPWISSGLKVCVFQAGERDTYLVQRVARLRPRSHYYSDYIYACIQSRGFEKHCCPTETTVPHISPVELKNFEVMLPGETLIARYQKVVSKVRKIIQRMESSQMHGQNLFHSISQKAFAGEL